ncbi:MAG: recombination regulator RecX [Prevotellaceae bacterium]|nr:recombination regulator RecX [Prevotellaceae bacterium]
MQKLQNKVFTADELLFKASAYCSLSEHCIFEVSEKLTARGATNKDLQKIIAYLLENNFLNEQRYTDAYVRDKFRFNKWGKRKIALMLSAKNIDKEVINNSLSLIDDDSNEALLADILQKKLKTLKFKNEYDCRVKLLRFAAGKGFEMREIEKAIRKVLP